MSHVRKTHKEFVTSLKRDNLNLDIVVKHFESFVQKYQPHRPVFDAVRSRNSPTYADYRKKIELERQFINKARILIDQTKSSDSIVKLVMDIEMSEQLYQVEKKQDTLETQRQAELNQKDRSEDDQNEHNKAKGVNNR